MKFYIRKEKAIHFQKLLPKKLFKQYLNLQNYFKIAEIGI